jgi:hypothetical protein
LFPSNGIDAWSIGLVWLRPHLQPYNLLRILKKVGKLLDHVVCIVVRHQRCPGHTPLATSLMWREGASTVYLPHTGGADCYLPTCCFNCHRLRHHLRDCKRTQKSLAPLGAFEASHDAHPPLRGQRTSKAPELASSDAISFLKSDLIFPMASVCFIPRSWDPMVEEAALGASIWDPMVEEMALGASVGALFHSCKEDAVGMVEQR